VSDPKARQARPVSDDPQRRCTSMIDHIMVGDFHGQVL
jgi:hypothetical protein